MANKKTYIYKFEKDGDTYKLTAKAIGNLFNIERILGKVMIKNKVYELIYIQSRHNPQNNGMYLTERKNLDCEVVKSFIYSCDTCWRSKQHHPYEKDLLDNELLNDLGLEVFTYKYYCSGDKLLVDHYEPIEKGKITEEFKKHLEEMTRSSIEEYEYHKNFKGYNEELIWEKV